MKLKHEYQKHLETLKFAYPLTGTVRDYGCMEAVIERLQTIADKPQVRLSRARLFEIYDADAGCDAFKAMMKVQEAILAAQREPEAIQFDYQKWIQGGWELYINGQHTLCLQRGGKYTMRRKK